MERIAGYGPDGEDGLIDCCCRCALLKCIRCAHVVRDVWVVTPGTRAIKKAPFRQERRFIKPGEIFVRRISPSAHRPAFAVQPPWDFSVPGWHPLVSPKGIPDVDTLIAEGRGPCKFHLCHKLSEKARGNEA